MTQPEDIRTENIHLRQQVRNLTAQNLDLQQLVDFIETIEGAQPEPPQWLAPPTTGDHHATAVVMLSDMHFDEVVRAEEMDGLNAYNRDIATTRLSRWTDGIIKMTRDYLSGVKWDGLVVIFGGDGLSGTIHEELTESNEDLPYPSMLHWIEQLEAAINELHDARLAGTKPLFPNIHCVVVPGNHPRATRKPRYKGRARDNLDWLMGRLMARDYRYDPQVTWQVPDSFEAYLQIYGWGQFIAHGDEAGGSAAGNGIGGIWPTVMRYRSKTRDVYMAAGKRIDTMWLGHWHQYIAGNGLIVNGSLKGYDEFARGKKFPFEPATQALAVMTPEHGLTWQSPIFVSNKQKEGW